ncbi:outer membrane protein assembly factor BamB family protein [Nonomuraea sp. H19]|uniref:outer membrane protein assembly factor BamB family protein n=1 Tax=Nonomuraea sp. H19 TaxID=3452206 RepID=UPI003F8C71B0
MTRRTAFLACVAALAGCRAEAGEVTAPASASPASRWPVSVSGQDAPPAVSAAALYVAGATGGIRALQPRTGAVIWQTHVPDKPGAPAINWQGTPLPVGDLLIVGNGRGEPAFGRANPSQVVALRASTGQVVWTASVDDYAHELVAVDGLILCRTNSTLYAFDPASGRERWHWPPGELKAMQLAGGTLLVTERLPRGERLVAVEAATGRRKWAAEFPKCFIDWVFASDGRLVVAGYPIPDEEAYELTALAERTGERTWSKTLDQISGFAELLEGTLYMADLTHVRALRVSTGSEVWSFPLTEKSINPALAVDAETVFAAMPVRLPSGLHPLYARQRDNGGKRWMYELRGAVSQLIADANGIVYATFDGGGRDTLIALDSRSGAKLWSSSIDDGGLLFAGKGLLYVVGRHIIAFDPATGARI